MVNEGLIKPNSQIILVVDKDNMVDRLDQFITGHFTHYSRTFFQYLIREKCVSINDKVVTKSSAPLREDDTVMINFPAARVVEPTFIDEKTAGISIIAMTDHFIIIHKPAHL